MLFCFLQSLTFLRIITITCLLQFKALVVWLNFAAICFLQTEDWVDIQVYVRTKRDFIVRVRGTEAAKAQADFDTQNIKDVYIGGASQHLRERYVCAWFLHLVCVVFCLVFPTLLRITFFLVSHKDITSPYSHLEDAWRIWSWIKALSLLMKKLASLKAVLLNRWYENSY